MIIVGIDENGYGPILGPLIITASAFKVEKRGNLWQILNISKNPDNYPERVVVTDSKKLFSRNSLRCRRAGEKTVAIFFSLLFKKLPKEPDSFFSKILLNFSLFPKLCLESKTRYKPCWGKISLPLWLKDIVVRGFSLAKIEKGIIKESEELKKKLKEKKIKFLGLKTICVCPFQFNKLAKEKNKSYLNYLQFEKLIFYFLQKKEKKFFIFADKIGGRKDYFFYLKSGLLKDWDCRILEESGEVSSYELNLKNKRANISFLQNGEEKEFPVALSSLFGKYTREIFIKRINRFFQNYNPELKSVSGYRDPLTKEFIKRTENLREELKINENCFLREEHNFTPIFAIKPGLTGKARKLKIIQ